MYDVIIPMAGSGTRLNLGYNKMLYMIEDKPMYQHTIDIFLSDNRCNKIILVVSETDKNTVGNWIKQFDKVVLTIGGETRTESVYNGLKEVVSDVCLIHDGARPLLSMSVLDEVVEKVNESTAVFVGVPVKDTIRKMSENIETLDRSELFIVQTPQAAYTMIFKEVYQKTDGSITFTDDISLIEYYRPDITIDVVVGEYNNIKITTVEDVDYFQFLLKKEGI